MSLPLMVRVAGVEFFGRPTDVRPYGLFLSPKGFGGWDDGVDVRRERVDRSGAHGSFDLPGLLDARVMSLSGHCIAGSEESLGWWRSKVTGLLADGSRARVEVEHEGSTRFTYARLASQTKFEVRGATPTIATFRVQFFSPDPRQYGELHTSFAAAGSVVSAHHYGNFPAAPTLTVAGSYASGYSITGPDSKVFTVTAPVVSGHPHTIDMATGYLYVDGVIVYGGITSAQAWAVPGGVAVEQTLTGAGSGTLTVAVRDTYI